MTEKRPEYGFRSAKKNKTTQQEGFLSSTGANAGQNTNPQAGSTIEIRPKADFKATFLWSRTPKPDPKVSFDYIRIHEFDLRLGLFCDFDLNADLGVED
jgi:hypothetical protein